MKTDASHGGRSGGFRPAWRLTAILMMLFATAACNDEGDVLKSGPGLILDECLPGQACGSGDGSADVPGTLACKGLDDQEFAVAPKTVTIHNNSGTETIYPVLATSKNAVNEWIQGCFRTTEDHPTHYVYKLYVNEGQGIPPNSAVTITLPLYSELPEGLLPNAKYITWWNGGRVVLADRSERLLDRNSQSNPNGLDHPLTTPDEVTCQARNTECRLTTYYSDVQFPEHIYAQLSEYTFGDSILPQGVQRRILKPENVGYNISYVDHVYMPVAIGPKNNPYIGYSGSVQSLSAFRSALSAFLKPPVGEGWPIYNLEELKLPGGYNIFAQRSGTLPPADHVPVKPPVGFPPVLTVLQCKTDGGCTDEQKASLHFGEAVQRMQNLWGSCVDWGEEDVSPYVTSKFACPSELQEKLAIVQRFFQQNHKNYLAMYNAGHCQGGAPLVPEFNYWQAITHIYGWVPFNEGCGASANPLLDTKISDPNAGRPQWDHARVQSMYIHELQYNHQPGMTGANDPKLLFNPYVQLIHDDLDMNAYAFSVDDAVGFMSELGDGLIFTVGGPQGLENDKQFDYAGGFTLALGVPTAGVKPDEPLIRFYGVCSLDENTKSPQCESFEQDVIMPTNSQIPSFRVGTVESYPIRVNFTDLNDNVYSVLVDEQFAPCPPGTDATGCPTNKAKIVRQSACIVTAGYLGPKHENSDRWCQSADPNQQKEKQLTKNYLSFAVPVDFLPK